MNDEIRREPIPISRAREAVQNEVDQASQEVRRVAAEIAAKQAIVDADERECYAINAVNLAIRQRAEVVWTTSDVFAKRFILDILHGVADEGARIYPPGAMREEIKGQHFKRLAEAAEKMAGQLPVEAQTES